MAEETQAQEAATTASANVELSAFYGIKAGMTRIFDEAGNHIPVTVIKLIPNVVTQVKTMDKDGYEAYQVGYGEKREKLITKPLKGQLAAAKTDKLVTKFAEIKANSVDSAALGKEVSIASFTANTMIDVTGVTKGKGMQGVIKRFNFAGGPGAHKGYLLIKGSVPGSTSSFVRISKAVKKSK